MLVSDPNIEIRELGAQSLKKLFQEKALPPLIWALDHEKSWQLLLYITSSILEFNSQSAKSVFLDKIKRLNNYKFIKSLTGLIKNEERLLSHENLLTKVCGETYRDARDLLRVHIQHLRQKLGDSVDSPSIIVTEHGMGYKFLRPFNN